nr:hypothetical protein [Janthinobacterium sp. Marseille]
MADGNDKRVTELQCKSGPFNNILQVLPTAANFERFTMRPSQIWVLLPRINAQIARTKIHSLPGFSRQLPSASRPALI